MKVFLCLFCYIFLFWLFTIYSSSNINYINIEDGNFDWIKSIVTSLFFTFLCWIAYIVIYTLLKLLYRVGDKLLSSYDLLKYGKTHIRVDFLKEEEEELPSNVIRIETMDGSDDYIQIEFPKDYFINNIEDKDKPLVDASAMFMPAIRGIKKVFDNVRGIKSNRSLSREEVAEILNGLRKGDKWNIRLVNNKEELIELWNKITQRSRKMDTVLDSKGNPIEICVLNDKTRILYRKYSSAKSNNLPTIEIHGVDKMYNRKIHIDIKK
ncbi:hypothetical protein [Campylobacter sp. CCUG 57310]|uniref:hypothetical protein n=1 Tax=Campylobacter sp. CCUG 57310 TaxID=2517362 RepID=UPI001565C479|nr:hypothetical protein [Campylobacter sp. CCUG 57310]